MESWNFKFVWIVTTIVMNGVGAELAEFYTETDALFEPRLKMCDRVPDTCIKVYSDGFYWPQTCNFDCSERGILRYFECSLWNGVLNGRPDCNDMFCISIARPKTTTTHGLMTTDMDMIKNTIALIFNIPTETCIKVYTGCFYFPQICRCDCLTTGHVLLSQCEPWYERLNARADCNDVYCVSTSTPKTVSL